MISARRSAQFGVVAAVVVMTMCLLVLARNAATEPFKLTAQPGMMAPDFDLAAVNAGTRNDIRLSDLRGSVVLISFSSTRCPVCHDYDARLAALYAQYGGPGKVNFITIQTGLAAQSPGDVAMQTRVANLNFPQLLDPAMTVALAYGVIQTPTFLLIDSKGLICYRGALDDNRTQAQTTTPFLEMALRELLKGKPISHPTSEVVGCVIR